MQVWRSGGLDVIQAWSSRDLETWRYGGEVWRSGGCVGGGLEVVEGVRGSGGGRRLRSQHCDCPGRDDDETPPFIPASAWMEPQS